MEANSRTNMHYRSYKIKVGRKVRRVDSPRRLLKRIQYELLSILEKLYEPPATVHGFTKNRSFLTNAKEHLGATHTLSIDIKDFFPSITKRHLTSSLKKIGVTMPEADFRVLTNLCLYQGKLPQGSPVSPIISNIVFHSIDHLLQEYCEDNNFKYTRYADDISISSSTTSPIAALRYIKYRLYHYNFTVNKQKTKLANRHIRQEITGTVINSGAVNMPRRWRKNARALFHNCTQSPIKNRQKYGTVCGYVNLLKQIQTINRSETNAKLLQQGINAQKKLNKIIWLQGVRTDMYKIINQLFN